MTVHGPVPWTIPNDRQNQQYAVQPIYFFSYDGVTMVGS